MQSSHDTAFSYIIHHPPHSRSEYTQHHLSIVSRCEWNSYYRRRSMFNLIKQTEIVEQACQQFLDPRPCEYNFNRQIIPLTNKNANLRLSEQQFSTSLKVGTETLDNTVKLHFITNTKNDENIIIYLHGLSSYCLEGKFLVPYLANSFSLCLYDSRSHGKNNAPFVTYGLLESLELVEVLRAVVRKGFKNIILWGRSMGAVTCLRAIQQAGGDDIMKYVRYVVADSPFGSFRAIASEIISKMTSLPQIFASILASAFSSRISQKYSINLDDISLEGMNSHIPMTFFHSSSDELISPKHVQLITKDYHGPKDVCDIKMAHNEERPVWVVLKAMSKIYGVLKEGTRKAVENDKKRGLSLTKFGSQKFLSVVTPSNLDTNLRKSMRIPPPNPTMRPHIPSSYLSHSKQNSNPPSNPNPKLKHSSIFSSALSSSYVRLGTPTSKARKSMLYNYY